MSSSNISGPSTGASSAIKTMQAAETKSAGGKKTVDDVLATLRELMPGWTISTTTADWGEGFRNIQIDRDILERMANDPKEMEKYKNIILDLEKAASALEKWEKENPGQSLVFELSLNDNGEVTAMSIVKTLLGSETRTTFEIPKDMSPLIEYIQQKIEAFSQGQVEDGLGSKSWIT